MTREHFSIETDGGIRLALIESDYPLTGRCYSLVHDHYANGTKETATLDFSTLLRLTIELAKVVDRSGQGMTVRPLRDDEKRMMREYLLFMQAEPFPESNEDIRSRLVDAANRWPSIAAMFGEGGHTGEDR